MKNNSFSYYLTKYFSDYLPNQMAASENTIHSYRDAIVQLLEFLHDKYNLSPEDLTYQDFSIERVEAFLNWLEEEKGVSISTRNHRLAAIHAFFRYVQYRDPAGFEQCCHILNVSYKKASVTPMNYMTVEETKYLLSLPNQSENSGLRDLAIMIIMYETGSRVQEVIDLMPSCLRFGTISTVELHGKGNKTRLVPIDAVAASIIRNYIRRFNRCNDYEPLFVNRKGEKLTRAGIQYIVDKYVSMAHEQKPEYFKKRITNHSFRHSKAMHLLESGVNLIYIRDLLGHTSVVTTEIYAKTNPKIKEEQLKKHSEKMVSAKRYSQNEKNDLLNWLKKNL